MKRREFLKMVGCAVAGVGVPVSGGAAKRFVPVPGKAVLLNPDYIHTVKVDPEEGCGHFDFDWLYDGQVVALRPYKDELLAICERSLWIVRSDDEVGFVRRLLTRRSDAVARVLRAHERSLLCCDRLGEVERMVESLELL